MTDCPAALPSCNAMSRLQMVLQCCNAEVCCILKGRAVSFLACASIDHGVAGQLPHLGLCCRGSQELSLASAESVGTI